MKINKLNTLALAGLMVSNLAVTVWAQPPKMKMTTPIPSEITTPDIVETRIGTSTGGGMIRDTLSQTQPLILCGEVYATPAAAGITGICPPVAIRASERGP